jgi:hypothetical protein
MEIRTGKLSVRKKYGFRSGGGLNHKRYDHKRRPTRIDVSCPNCGSLAIATDIEATANSIFTFDMGPSWEKASFSVKCTKCTYTKNGLDYFQIPKPFHEIYVYGERLWAWNLQHLNMIYRFLNDENIEEHAYASLQTYIHGKWKKGRLKFSKAISQHLSTHNLSFENDAQVRHST